MSLWDRLRLFGSRQRDYVPKSEQSNDAVSQGWIPLALETPILFGFMVLSLLLFAAIETLAQKSQVQGALALSPSYEDIPQYAMISYRYGPNIIAVLYSLIWNWIDLDLKRMQPWFELSKPSGALAKDSIFLDYPSTFFASAPFQAVRKKHWTVFLSGTTMLLIISVLTPLQPTLMGVAVLAQNESVTITTRSNLLPVNEQSLTSRVFSRSYTTGVLNQSYPPFTTTNYALLPFYINDGTVVTGAGANWTAETTKVWSDFSCSPIKHNMTKSKWDEHGILSSEYKYYGANNCTATISYTGLGPKFTPLPGLPDGKDITLSYIPCPDNSNSSYSAIATWAKEVKKKASLDDKEWEMNTTGVYCELSYHKQRVTATVTSQSQAPIDGTIQPLEEPQDLGFGEFNFATLTSLLYDPISSIPEFNSTIDWGDFIRPQMEYVFDSWNIEADKVFLHAFTLGDSNATRDDYSDPSRLGDIMQRFHRHMFALSIPDLLSNETLPSNNTATVTSHMTGIIVSRSFSTALEATLLLVAVMVASILYFVRSSPCNLLKNPSSIGRLLDIGHASPDVVRLFHAMGTADEKHIVQSFEDTTFKLVVNPLSNNNELIVLQNDGVLKAPVHDTTPGYYTPLTPWILKRRSGATFITILIGSIIFLSIFKTNEIKSNGLLRPSDNPDVLRILENYLPTIFATLTGAIWIYLTRTLCIVQPFQDLWAGNSPAATSIEATYTALPPQLVLFRAIKFRHLMLVLLCSSTLLGDLLSVGLGALFNEKPIDVKYQQKFEPISQERINYTQVVNYNNYWMKKIYNHSPTYHNFITMANLSFNSPLPPWVSADWYFLPHSIPKTDGNASDVQYVIQTRGYGVGSNCTSTPTCSLTLTNITKDELNTTTTIEYTSTDNIGKHYITYHYNDTDATDSSACSSASSNIRSSLEGWVAPTLDQPAQLAVNSNGNIAWLRRSPEPNQNNTVDGTFIECAHLFETAIFSVTVDQNGRVLEYSRISDIESTIGASDPSEPENLGAQLFQLVTNSVLYGAPSWSYTNRTVDWMAQFIMGETGSRSMFDPTTPLSDIGKFGPAFKKINRLLFAAFLSVNPQLFLELDENTSPLIGERVVREIRIFMDKTAFVITVSVLFINLVVIVVFYVRPVRHILPRMPTTIGSVLAYIAPSRAVKSGTPSSGWKDQTFSYGRYIGYDGLSHVGIEMDPHVLQKDVSLGLHKPILGREKHRANEL